MEKRRPHHSLAAIKADLARVLRMSTTARTTALALGFDEAGVRLVVASVSRLMFYKSMTSYADSQEWQDVYHVPATSPVKGAIVLYVKFTRMMDGHWVLSFKEK